VKDACQMLTVVLQLVQLRHASLNRMPAYVSIREHT
jgi:hypothetical protein